MMEKYDFLCYVEKNEMGTPMGILSEFAQNALSIGGTAAVVLGYGWLALKLDSLDNNQKKTPSAPPNRTSRNLSTLAS